MRRNRMKLKTRTKASVSAAPTSLRSTHPRDPARGRRAVAPPPFAGAGSVADVATGADIGWLLPVVRAGAAAGRDDQHEDAGETDDAAHDTEDQAEVRTILLRRRDGFHHAVRVRAVLEYQRTAVGGLVLQVGE